MINHQPDIALQEKADVLWLSFRTDTHERMKMKIKRFTILVITVHYSVGSLIVLQQSKHALCLEAQNFFFHDKDLLRQITFFLNYFLSYSGEITLLIEGYG